MYSLDSINYTKEFENRQDLLDDIIESGSDPNYEVTKDGVPQGETAWDLIEPAA